MGGTESVPKVVTGVISPELKSMIDQNDVVMFTWWTCPYCSKAKQILNEKGIKFNEINSTNEIGDALYEATGQSSVPSIWIKGNFIGGCNDGPEDWMGLTKCLKSGKFDELLKS